jgi:hypothetical protein
VILVAVSALCILLLVIALFYYRDTSWGKLGLAAVLGGAMGNFIDRLAIGYVVDMFEFEFVNFAVFNVADIFITLGCIVFGLYYIFHSKTPRDDGNTEIATGRVKHPAGSGVGLLERAGREDEDDGDAQYARGRAERRRVPPEGGGRSEAQRPSGTEWTHDDIDEMHFTAESILEEYALEKLLSERGKPDGES